MRLVNLRRRDFLRACAGGLASLSGHAAAAPVLRLWAFSDAHVGTDKRSGRNSLADALTQSESGGPSGDRRSNGMSPSIWVTNRVHNVCRMTRKAKRSSGNSRY